MDSQQIEQYLGFLGQKLAEMQIQATIILLGGALMLIHVGNRKTTQDRDIVIATNDRRTYQAVQQAITLVAQEQRLPPRWLNDDVTIVVDQIGKPKALKLFSGRPQDDRDIQALAQRLNLNTKALAWALVNQYIPTPQLHVRIGYTTQAVDRCFQK